MRDHYDAFRLSVLAAIAIGVAGCGASDDAQSGPPETSGSGTLSTNPRTTMASICRSINGGKQRSCTCALPATPVPSGSDWVNGPVTYLNDNGAWSWFSDQRAVIDGGKRLVFSSVADSAGPGNAARSGQVELTIYDLATNAFTRAIVGKLVSDDHNAGAVMIRPDGNYVTMWAGHNQDCKSYYRTYVTGVWSAQMSFDWEPLGCSLASRTKVTYSNLWNMSSEGKVYSFVRSIGTSPNLLVSSDQGASWAYGGRLTSTPRVGYVAGYYKYWGNGVGRIDFVGTEEHPRDFDNSLYHGYVKDGKTFDSADNLIDASLADNTVPSITAFTKVFAAGSTVGSVALVHAWNIDLVRYDDGSIAILWEARVLGSDPKNPDHRFGYARFDGKVWTLTYLARGGLKLYASEQDYTGLGALDPDDPQTVYISTPYDPRDDKTFLGHHEIFRGTTCDDGATWHWTEVTANSTRDNLRPVIPKWDANHSALLWFRGSYYSMNSFATEVVGIISNRDRH